MIPLSSYLRRAAWIIRRFISLKRPVKVVKNQGIPEFDPIMMEGHNLEGLASSGCYAPILYHLLNAAAPLSGLLVNVGAGFCRKCHLLGKEYDWLGKDCTYVGIDINPKVRPDILGNIQNLKKIGTGTACLIICTETLFYAKHPDRAVAEMKRVLRPGGYIFIVEPMLYPRMEKPGRWCNDRNRFFSDDLVYRPSIIAFLKKFSEWFGKLATPDNIKEIMSLDLYHLRTYRVFNIDELLGDAFSNAATYPLFDSPQENSIQLLLFARRVEET